MSFDFSNIPVKCQLCWYCQREEGFCGWEYDENEPKLPFVDNCDEFKFEVLYLIDFLDTVVFKK